MSINPCPDRLNRITFSSPVSLHWFASRTAPESCHAIAAAVREANQCKETGEEKVILFNLSGHGLIDMASYDKYLAGDLVNYALTDEDIQKNLDEIGDLSK